MKKRTYLLAILTFVTVFNVSAQANSGKILKVQYETTNVSKFLVEMLKSQISDPKKYSEVLNRISQHKIFHTLYYNPETSESFFIMDSIHEVQGISTVGHVQHVYHDSGNSIFGQETFMGKSITFKDSEDAIKWEITDEKKEISGFQAIKASLKSNPEIEVWFTPEIAVKTGPYLYFGLPGLVLESHGIFKTTNVSKVAYLTDESFLQEKKLTNSELMVDQGISINELLTKKNNFQIMASKGKK